MVVLDMPEREMLAATVRGEVARAWGGPTTAGATEADGRLAALAARAADQGWWALADEGLLDGLLVVAEELGRAACPLPVTDAFVAWRVLAGDDAAAHRIAAGTWRVVLGVRAAGSVLAEGAQTATHVLVLPEAAGGRAELHEVSAAFPRAGMAAPPWRVVETAGAGPVATAELDATAADAARAVARLGIAARALGAARRAHELAFEHARERTQFGRLIGSFQAVAHRIVDAEIDVRSASLLLDEAVRAERVDAGTFLLAAELAVSHVARVAPAVELAAHHTLAAVGYFEEHDAPWLFRRVHADGALLHAFPLAAGGVGDQLVDEGRSLPDPDLGPAAAAFRTELGSLLDGLDDGTWAERDGDDDDPRVLAALAEEGLLAVTWPRDVGGRGASPEEAFVLGEEVARRRVPVNQALNALGMIGGALYRYGSDDQRARFLPLFAAGQVRFYLAYSEPEVGSDLARLSTRADRDGDDWVITGRKMWGTGAHRADWAWVAARTDPHASPPHAGITVFLIPTRLPGWEAQQHRALSGGISCSTFFDGVRVPDAARVGDVNGGWTVITAALAGERAVIAGATAGVLHHLDELVAALRDGTADPGPPSSARRARLGELATRIQAARLLGVASVRAVSGGAGSRLEAPMAKIRSTELGEALYLAALDLLGPAVALGAPAPGVPGGGELEHAHRHSLMQSIGGGTRDIQRNLVARGLGLPR